MSLEQHVFLKKSMVPSRSGWQAAIDSLGVKLALDKDLRPFDFSGFLPCKLNGNDSGFEVYYEQPEEILDAYPRIKNEISDKDFVISFRWGGDLAECVCVLLASAALSRSFDGLVYFPQDDCFMDSVALIREANEAMKMMDKAN